MQRVKMEMRKMDVAKKSNRHIFNQLSSFDWFYSKKEENSSKLHSWPLNLAHQCFCSVQKHFFFFSPPNIFFFAVKCARKKILLVQITHAHIQTREKNSMKCFENPNNGQRSFQITTLSGSLEANRWPEIESMIGQCANTISYYLNV